MITFCKGTVSNSGIYAVCSVLYGVATFNDCSQAREELIKEIEEAKQDLRERKVIA